MSSACRSIWTIWPGWIRSRSIGRTWKGARPAHERIGTRDGRSAARRPFFFTPGLRPGLETQPLLRSSVEGRRLKAHRGFALLADQNTSMYSEGSDAGVV